MLRDLVAGFACDGLDQRFEIIAFEDRCFTALPAKKQVLVSGGCGDERLTSLRRMDALDQSLFFERLKRPVNGDESQRGMSVARFMRWTQGR